jgi:trans-aconitate methyltransferase
MPSIDHYNALMAGCRFADYRVWPQNDDRIFPNAAAMTGWLEQPSLVPFLAVLPDHLQASFRDEAVQDMIKRTARSDGACLEVFRRINVFARKA